MTQTEKIDEMARVLRLAAAWESKTRVLGADAFHTVQAREEFAREYAKLVEKIDAAVTAGVVS